MPIVYAAVLPHGALVLQPKDPISKKLNESMIKVAEEVEQINPNLLILSTPHGLMLQNNFAFYHSQKAKGSAEWQGKYEEFTLEIELEPKITKELANHLKTEMITPHVPTLPIEIAWGEVIPLFFIYQKVQPPALILSHPARRYKHPEQMNDEVQYLGRKIAEFFEHREERVAVIISGDWAHTHSKDGPYGHSETAKPFDHAIEGWLKNLHLKNDQWKDHRENAAKLVNSALSCGFTGLYLLDGIIKGDWIGQFHTIGAPSYYGMAVASYRTT